MTPEVPLRAPRRARTSRITGIDRHLVDRREQDEVRGGQHLVQRFNETHGF